MNFIATCILLSFVRCILIGRVFRLYVSKMSCLSHYAIVHMHLS